MPVQVRGVHLYLLVPAPVERRHRPDALGERLERRFGHRAQHRRLRRVHGLTKHPPRVLIPEQIGDPAFDTGQRFHTGSAPGYVIRARPVSAVLEDQPRLTLHRLQVRHHKASHGPHVPRLVHAVPLAHGDGLADHEREAAGGEVDVRPDQRISRARALNPGRLLHEQALVHLGGCREEGLELTRDVRHAVGFHEAGEPREDEEERRGRGAAGRRRRQG